MKVLKIILIIALFLFLGCFISWGDYVTYGILIPLISIIVAVLIAPVLRWFKPHWFNRDWPYLSERQREEYLNEQKEKRERFSKKFRH